MKKRLISVLLTVLMVMSLFSGMSLSAYADNTTTANTIQYQMVNGDNVFMICQRLGINFYDCKAAIMKLNGITDGMWSSLPVGKVLTLPASNADGIKIGSGGIGGTTVTTGSGANASTAQISATVTDPVAYYLIPYTMSRGETVSGVCNQLGINFNAYSEQIKKINGITNWTKVNAGSQLLLPSAKAPAVGTSCYAVLAHKVVKDETAYSIASSKGVSYAGNKTLLQALNNTNNLNKIKTGDNFYVPVATTIAPADVSGSTTGTGTATTTSSSGTSGSGTSGSTTPAVKTYKLSTNINSAAGTLQFYVKNKAATEAAAGDKVTVVVDMNKGKALKSLTVKHLDGKGELLLTGDTFIMPSCDVRVDVEVESGYDINITANYTGKAAANVGGIAVTSAVKGAKVFIVSTDPSYEVESATVTYKKLLGSKTEVPVSESMGFVMPDAKVNVEVKLKPVTTYDFYVNDPDHGSFFLQVNGSNVSKAAKGAQVTIVTKSQEGYEPTKIEVWRLKDDGSDDKQISVINGKFTMPAADVRVEVLFSAQGNNIVFMPAKGGTATAEVDSATVTEADTGAEVTLVPNAESGYTLKRFDVVRNSDGYKVKVTESSGDYKFSMPNGGVTVTPVFEGDLNNVDAYLYLDDAVPTDYMDCSYTTSDSDTHAVIETEKHGIQYHYGDYIDLKVDTVSAIGFDSFEIYVGGASEPDEELTNQANLKGYFEMPNDSVEIRGYFVSGKVSIGEVVYVPSKSATVSYILNAGVAGKERTTNVCKPGETVTVVVDPAMGYYFDAANYAKKLIVTRKDTGAKLTLTPTALTTGKVGYSFTMPAEGVNVQAYLEKNAYVITLKTRDVAGNDLTGLGLWKVVINGEEHSVENSVSQIDVSYNDKLTFRLPYAGSSAYTIESVLVDNTEYKGKIVDGALTITVNGTLAKDFEIIAVLNPKNPAATLYKLTYNADSKYGNAQFIILDSIFDFDSDKYVHAAHAGDKVGIVPSVSATGYTIDADHIVVTDKNGHRIHVQEETVAGKTVYTFTMPEKGYKSIDLNFYAVPYNVVIEVLDSGSSTDITSYGFAKLDYVAYDVASVLSSTSVGTIPFDSNVEAHRTQVAKTGGWKIDSVTVTCFDSAITAPTPEAMSPEGYKFKMPASDIKVTINMSGGTLPSTPAEVTLPTATQDGSLPVTCYSDAAMTTIITKANAGTKVYMQLTTPLEAGYKLEEGLYAYDNDNSVKITLGSDGGFTVPNTTDLQAFGKKVPCEVMLKVKFENMPSDVTSVEVAGFTVADGNVIDNNLKVGDSVSISVNGSSVAKIEEITGMDNVNIATDTTATADIPVAEDGATVTMTIKFYKLVKLKIDGSDLPLGTKIKVNGTEVTDGEEIPNMMKGDEVTVDISGGTAIDLDEVQGLDEYVADGNTKGKGKVPEPSGEVVTIKIVPVKYYELTFQFSGGSEMNFNGSNVNAGNTYAAVIPGSTYVIKAPSGLKFESVSCSVFDSTIVWSDLTQTEGTVTVNDIGVLGGSYRVSVELASAS